MSTELPFEPFPIIASSHGQTIVGSFMTVQKQPKSDTKYVQLVDGDRLALEISTPARWKQDDLSVIMIHGLCGSHKSPYLVRLTKKLEERRVRAIRINLRGCGSGKGLAKHLYHGGQSCDIFETVKILKEEYPLSPIILVGFSLGGNIVLKLGGELGYLAKDYLQEIICICPPVDIYSSVRLLGSPSNRIYERYFIRLLRCDVYFRHGFFKDLPDIELPKDMSILDFDNLYTAPHFGFVDAIDYYQTCSSKNFIPEIKVPCKILLSEDDPIISPNSLNEIKLPANIEVYKTRKGGHVGYLGSLGKKFYWLDSLLLDWML